MIALVVVAAVPTGVAAGAVGVVAAAATGLGYLAAGASAAGVGVAIARKRVDESYSNDRFTADVALGSVGVVGGGSLGLFAKTFGPTAGAATAGTWFTYDVGSTVAGAAMDAEGRR